MNTRERIIEAALALFSQRGYGGVSIREIARAVGLRESSLYNHFASKRAIFDAIVDACFQRAQEYFQDHALPFRQGDDTALYQGIGVKRLQELMELSLIHI